MTVSIIMVVALMELYNYYRLCIPPPNYLVSSAARSPQIYQEDIQRCIQELSSDMVRELSYFLETPVARIFLLHKNVKASKTSNH